MPPPRVQPSLDCDLRPPLPSPNRPDLPDRPWPEAGGFSRGIPLGMLGKQHGHGREAALQPLAENWPRAWAGWGAAGTWGEVQERPQALGTTSFPGTCLLGGGPRTCPVSEGAGGSDGGSPRACPQGMPRPPRGNLGWRPGLSRQLWAVSQSLSAAWVEVTCPQGTQQDQDPPRGGPGRSPLSLESSLPLPPVRL